MVSAELAMPYEEQYTTRSPAETRRLARRLAAALPSAAVLALYGELGSGKTCFVQGLAAALGVTGPVTSPTFTLIHEYRGPRPLYHIDLYRIGSADEALMLGLEDYLPADGLTAVEWAERSEDLLPPDTVRVHFDLLPDPAARRITVRYPGPARSSPGMPRNL